MRTHLYQLDLLGLSRQTLLLTMLAKDTRVQPSHTGKPVRHLLGPSWDALQPCRGQSTQPIVLLVELGLLVSQMVGVVPLQHANMSAKCRNGHIAWPPCRVRQLRIIPGCAALSPGPTASRGRPSHFRALAVP